MQDVVVVLTTLPAEGDVGAFARTLVEEHLAACVNIHAPMTSIYWWDGKVQEDAERQLTIKTSADRLQGLQDRLRELHPYDVPEFLVLEVADASEAYSRWVRTSTEAAHPP
jgi:periplasmic divalent cation tolerance protein